MGQTSGMSGRQMGYLDGLAAQLGYGDGLDLIADRYEDCDRRAAKNISRSMTVADASGLIEWAVAKVELRTPHAEMAAAVFGGVA